MWNLKNELGRGRNRGPKSNGNENIEESLTYLFSTSCVEVEIFPDASHSYRSYALLPLPFCLLNCFIIKRKYTCAYIHVIWDAHRETESGTKVGLRAVSMGTWGKARDLSSSLTLEDALFWVFLLPPCLFFFGAPPSSFWITQYITDS